MKICPHCGGDLTPPPKPKPAKPPYEYRGCLKPYLPLILQCFRRGIKPAVITTMVQLEMQKDHFELNTYWGTPTNIHAIIINIGVGHKFYEQTPAKYILQYKRARQEHAWLLRAEGVKLKDIGARLGIGKAAAGGLIQAFNWRIRHATKHTHWSISKTLDSFASGHN